MLTDEGAARAKVEKDREQMIAVAPDELAEQIKSLLTPTDAAVLTGDIAGYLAYTGREGLAPGSQGWWDDSRALASGWGFDLADISVPVLLMHSSRISSCRSGTASGWRRTSRESRRGCSTTTGT